MYGLWLPRFSRPGNPAPASPQLPTDLSALGLMLLSAARAALKVCLRCHIRLSVFLIVLICLLDHMERWSLATFSGWDQHCFASASCLAVAVSGQSCRKCHNVSAFGCPMLRQNLQAFLMHTSVGRTGSPALRPWPPQSSLDMVMAGSTL